MTLSIHGSLCGIFLSTLFCIFSFFNKMLVTTFYNSRYSLVGVTYSVQKCQDEYDRSSVATQKEIQTVSGNEKGLEEVSLWVLTILKWQNQKKGLKRLFALGIIILLHAGQRHGSDRLWTHWKATKTSCFPEGISAIICSYLLTLHYVAQHFLSTGSSCYYL